MSKVRLKYNKEQVIAQKEGATSILIHCFDDKSEEFFKRMEVTDVSFKGFNGARAEFNYSGILGKSVFSKGLDLVPGQEFEATHLVDPCKDLDANSFNQAHKEMLELFDLSYYPSSDYNSRIVYARGNDYFSMAQLRSSEPSSRYREYLINMTKDIIVNRGTCYKIVFKRLKELTVTDIVSLGTYIDYEKYPSVDDLRVNEHQYIESFKDWYTLQYGEYNPETCIYLCSYKK